MIEVINPGWLSLFVDRGRYGFARLGVPPSSALDRYAFDAVNHLLGNPAGTPVLEVVGKGFAVTSHVNVKCAVTGARVRAFVNADAVPSWAPFPLPRGSRLTVEEVEEGFRYYIGFSASPALDEAMGSSTTNMECGFGGYKGRPLVRGDVVEFEEVRSGPGERERPIRVPAMAPPHRIRVVEGPEIDCFTDGSRTRLFGGEDSPGFRVSPRSNRTGVRLEGKPLFFRKGREKSIVSEGVLPGTIQIPGDGLPVIVLHERTVGGYARAGVVVRADRDRLAHLKPWDRVFFERVSIEEALALMDRKGEELALPDADHGGGRT